MDQGDNDSNHSNGPHSNLSAHSSRSSNASVGYSDRLESFTDYPPGGPVNIIHLAKQGFVYDKLSPTSYSVTCTGCSKKVENWKVGDKPGDPQFHEAHCHFLYESTSLAPSARVQGNRATVQGNGELTKPLETGFQAGTNIPQSQRRESSPVSQSLVPARGRTDQYPVRESSSLPTHMFHEVTTVQRTEGRDGRRTNVETVRSLSRQESTSSQQRQQTPSPTPSLRSVQSSQFSYQPLSPVSMRSQSSSIQESLSSSINRPSTSQHEDLRRLQSRVENPDTLEEILMNFDMRNAENRLYTFERFWSTDNVFRNIRLLVICGFYCIGQGDAVECFCCHVIIANWSRNDNPRQRHEQLFPRCRFIKGENCGDVPLPPELRRSARTATASSSPYSSIQPQTHSLYSSMQSHRSIQSQPRSPYQSLGPISQPSTQGAAASAEQYGSPSRTRLERTNLMSQPRSPYQSLGQISQPSIHGAARPYGNPSRAMLERSNLMIEFPCDNPANPAMREERVRLQTFTHSQFRQYAQLRASDETFAMAGLFYTGNLDWTRCWFCDGGLKDFLPGDDPWVEHAKYFPHCEYLLQQRGPAWVTSISIQNPDVQRPVLPTREQAGLPMVVSSPTPLPAPPGRIDDPQQMLLMREQMLEDGMRSDPVLTALQMGFPDETIRDIQMQKIINDGCCYQSSEQLVQALLNPDEDPDEEPQGNVVNLDGQTFHIRGGNFIGPSVINGRYYPPSSHDGLNYTTTYSTSNEPIYIDGMPMDQFMANAFDHPFFRGEMEHSMPTRVWPHTRRTHTFNNVRRRINTIGTQAPPTVQAQVPPVRIPPPPRPTTPSSSSSTSSPSSTEASAPTGSVQERLAVLERERSCKICLNSPSEILFQPCGHICACADCAQRVTDCPVCRRRIVKYIRTYHA